MNDPGDDAPDGDPVEEAGPEGDRAGGAGDDGRPAEGHGEDEESDWQFSLQDIEDRQAEAEAAAEAEQRRREPLEAGDPSLENAVFVLLGALFALFVISRLFVL